MEIEYRLIETVEEFREALAELKGSSELLPYAIAICDLMRARSDSNGMEAIGFELYREARDDVKMPDSRIFILSGFPNHFQDKHPGNHFPENRVFQKPTPAQPLVNQIIDLFPQHIRL